MKKVKVERLLTVENNQYIQGMMYNDKTRQYERFLYVSRPSEEGRAFTRLK